MNVPEQIQRLDSEMTSASDQGSDLLAPEHFKKAREKLADARKGLERGKSQKDIREDLELARAHFVLAQQAAERARTLIPNILLSRNAAIRAGAARLYPDEFLDSENRFRDLTARIEKGTERIPVEDQDQVRAGFRQVELKAEKSTLLGEADSAIESAKKLNAKKRAPKTWAEAEAAHRRAEAAIETRWKNDDTALAAVKEANDRALALLEVARMIDGAKGNLSEDVAIAATDRRRETEAQEAKIAAARNVFRGGEGEVFRSGDAIVVRLRKDPFVRGSANISRAAVPTLQKLRDVVSRFPDSRVVVQTWPMPGGSVRADSALNRARASTIRDWLVNWRAVAANAITTRTVGVGETTPSELSTGIVDITIFPGGLRTSDEFFRSR